MKLIVLWVFNILVTVLAKHDSEVDLQTDYLKKQMGIAKSHPKVNGEINFSPDEKVFSNIVRSITGTKVSDDGRSEIHMELLPEATSGNVNRMIIVFHAEDNCTMVQGLVIDILVSCKNLTAPHFLFSYNTTELDETKEWLELSMNMTEIPCSLSEKCIFSAHIPGNCTFLDAMLIVYDFSPYEGITIGSVKKRSTNSNTLLSVYQDAKLNCSVQSVFLNYRNEFPLFADESMSVISPNSTGMNMTFCYGICSDLYLEQPLNISSTTRRHFISDILQDLNATIPLSCCVPDIIEYQEMIINVKNELSLQAFPQVTKCQCVV